MIKSSAKRIQNYQSWYFLGVLFVALTLSGCGFKLKGYNEGVGAASFKSAKVEANGAHRDVVHSLEFFLKESDVQLVDSMASAELVIRLGKTDYQRSTTGKTSAGDTSSELIKMTQPFSVEEVSTGKEVASAQVSSFRDRNVDANQAQASNRELKSIQKQMADELALQVLERVNRAYSPGLK